MKVYRRRYETADMNAAASSGVSMPGRSLPAKIAETLYPREISVEGGEVSGR